MTVEIPPEHQEFVKDAIARGEFKTESEVIGEALRLLEERRTATERLRREIQLGIDELDRGEHVDYDDKSLKEFFEQIKAEGRAALGIAPKDQ
jgi:antitoxin ParD1/3/4